MLEIRDPSEALDLSVILLARNEQGAVASVIAQVREAQREWPGKWEIVVVDDASMDETARAAESAGARVIRRPEMGGYGMAVKTDLQLERGSRDRPVWRGRADSPRASTAGTSWWISAWLPLKLACSARGRRAFAAVKLGCAVRKQL